MSDEVLVKVEGVSKKFCRSLKRSLWYGVQDVGAEMLGRSGRHDELRKNEFWAVQDVSFELKRGECLGLIGPNGAGKSTLLKLLNGLVKPEKGRITLRGRVGALIELGAGFNPILTARENIYVNGAVLGFRKEEVSKRFDEIVDYSGVEEFIDTPLQNFSSGMKVRLGFSVAIMLEPEVLLVDEVLAVGDLSFRQKCFKSLTERKQSGMAIILVSHNIIDVMRLANLGMVIQHGKLEFFGSIGKATSVYNAMISEKHTGVGRDRGCRFVSVKLFNSGRETCDFKTGDDVEVLAEIYSSIELQKVRVNFHIDTAAIRLNSTSSVLTNFNFQIVKGKNRLKLVIKNLPLLQGGYVLNLDLYGPKTDDLIDHTSPVRFFVTDPPSDYQGFGVCHLLKIDHAWSVVD